MTRICPNPECPDREATGRPGEYRDSVERCPACGATLEVPPPPVVTGAAMHDRPPASVDEDDLVEVLVTADSTEVEVVRSVLAAAGIDWVESDPVGAGFGAFGRIVIGPGSAFGPVRFRVRATDAAEARAVLSTGDSTMAPD